MARVLIVDDEESILFSFKRILKGAGHDVSVAAHLAEGKEILSSAEQDVALVDRMLSHGQTGIDLVRLVKKKQPFCETILISADPTFESACQVLRYGVFAYLRKPVKKNELCRMVADAALKSRLQMEYWAYGDALQTFFDRSPNAVVVFDLNNRIKFVNPTFKKIFGYKSEDLIGKPLPNIPPWDREKTLWEMETLLKGSPVRKRETQRMTLARTLHDVSLTQILCLDGKGAPHAVLVIMSDITKQKQAQEKALPPGVPDPAVLSAMRNA